MWSVLVCGGRFLTIVSVDGWMVAVAPGCWSLAMASCCRSRLTVIGCSLLWLVVVGRGWLDLAYCGLLLVMVIVGCGC